MKSSAERAGLLSCAPRRSWSTFRPAVPGAAVHPARLLQGKGAGTAAVSLLFRARHVPGGTAGLHALSSPAGPDVIAYVDAHRDQRVTAAQLGWELGVSTEQLRASVQQVYGKPLYQCIRAYKMRVAARLLEETDRTVLDIAGEFGYGNSSKFAAAFREVLGASPGEYRQKNSPSLWSEDSADWSGNTPADLV